GFLCPGYEHIGNLLKLSIADLCADFVIAYIQFHAQVFGKQSLVDLASIIQGLFRYRQDLYLDRREPYRECSRVVLDQNAYESLIRAMYRSMNDHRDRFRVMLVDVSQAEVARLL